MAKKNNADEFVISLQLGDELYSGAGATALEALRSLPKPDKIVLKGMLTVSQGEKSRTNTFFPARLRRLFYNKMFMEIQAKQLTIGMK